MVCLRPESRLRRGGPPGRVGRMRRDRSREYRPRIPADHQRSGQRRTRDYHRIHPSRHAPRVWSVLLFVQGTDRRWPPQARSAGARRKDRFLRRRSRSQHLQDQGGAGRAARRLLHRAQRYQYGRAPCFRYCGGSPLGPARVHRAASGNQEAAGGQCDGPGPGHRLSRPGAGRYDARDSSDLSPAQKILPEGALAMSSFTFPYPFFPVQFTKEGAVFQQPDVDALMTGLHAGVTDLFVISHGWNNNMDDAKHLYSGLCAQLAAQIGAVPALNSRTYAICGILWPSKKFEDQELIPSGAASLNDAVSEDQLRARVRGLADLIQAKGLPMEAPDPAVERQLGSVMQSVGDWADKPAVRKDVVSVIRGLLPAHGADAEDATDRFFSMNADLLVTNLSRSLNPPQNLPQGASAASLDPFSSGPVSGLGGAAGFRDVLGGVQSALLHLLNFTTYYLMKARAGDVGVKGVKPLIEAIRGLRPDLRLHLMGHSF